MVLVVTVAVVMLGQLLSRFSMTASPRSLRRPRVASARRNRICTQAACPRARGCGAPRADHAPLCAPAPAQPENHGQGSSGRPPLRPHPKAAPAWARPTEPPAARPRPRPGHLRSAGPGAPGGPRQRLSGPASLAVAAGDQEEDGEDGEEEERIAGRGSEGARGRGPWRPPPAGTVPTPALLPGRHPPGVQTSPRDQGTAPPGAG